MAMDSGVLANKVSGMSPKEPELPTMNVVILGHVDHGKSTVVGRMLYETRSLPEGKFEQVKNNCERSGKPFEFAFLIDALRDEQAQGITIDSARVFFRSAKRRYIIIDAPGHIEFLKNMISGAARAEAAILIVDALEGIQENSRRHGYMASMLGIKQLVVVINKMDLVDYKEQVFKKIQEEYNEYLKAIKIEPKAYIPVSGRKGDNLITLSKKMEWFRGQPLLKEVDSLSSLGTDSLRPLRMPVQDVYKFATLGDDKRIVAGTITSGLLRKGDLVEFKPSRKRSQISNIEGFNISNNVKAFAGQATGITLKEQVYIQPGEIMHLVEELSPLVGTGFRANIFWLAKKPLELGKRYKLKIATMRVTVQIKEIVKVMDAVTLTNDTSKQFVGRHGVAECILETFKPIAFDLASDFTTTGRFVLVEDYEIAGGGIIIEYLTGLKHALREQVNKRNLFWKKSLIKNDERIKKFKQKPKLVTITGENISLLENIARLLEARLFNLGKLVYCLDVENLNYGLASDLLHNENRDEVMRQLAEISHIMSDAGLIVISTVKNIESYEIETLKVLTEPNEMIVIKVGKNKDEIHSDLNLADDISEDSAVLAIQRLLREREVLLEYYL